MKNIITCLLMLASSIISLDTFADWTIPGTHCTLISPEYINSEDPAHYDSTTNSIRNSKIRPDENTSSRMHIRCSSPVYTGYGKYLDMDFNVQNASRDLQLACSGYSLDENGKVVQEVVPTVAVGRLQTITMSTNEYRRLSNAKPVTVVAECAIPDGGIEVCGSHNCGPRDGFSELFSIRVY